jgi:hypothetical protein
MGIDDYIEERPDKSKPTPVKVDPQPTIPKDDFSDMTNPMNSEPDLWKLGRAKRRRTLENIYSKKKTQTRVWIEIVIMIILIIYMLTDMYHDGRLQKAFPWMFN